MTEPQRVDRRAFLARTAALGAGAALPAIAAATPVSAATAPPEVEPRSRDISELTVAEAATLIRRGKLHPGDLLAAYRARVERFDAVYQAYNYIADHTAEPQKPKRGVLHGIPLAIKDNYFTAGMPTTVNSFLFEGFTPPFDATAVARLRAAGAVIVGKTQMGPLATTRATTPDGLITTVNAWAPSRPEVDPGGSSTGTATAVAGRMAAGGTGTQTGGSITAPSNAQNLTGLKPTMGRVSLHGIVPLSYTRDHPGPLARDAMDAALLLSTMAGPDLADPRTQGLPRVPDLVTAATPVRGRLRWPTRIGILPGYTADPLRSAFVDTLSNIRGVRIVEVPFPAEWELLTGGVFNNVRLPERSEPFLPQLATDLRKFGVSVLGWLQGALLGANEFLIGQRAKMLLLDRVLSDTFSRCDVVVQTSPVPFDILGLPELALPIGFTAAGLPAGTILGGQPFAEDRLLSVAAAYQAVTDWHHRRPADPTTSARAASRRMTAEEVVETME